MDRNITSFLTLDSPMSSGPPKPISPVKLGNFFDLIHRCQVTQ